MAAWDVSPTISLGSPAATAVFGGFANTLDESATATNGLSAFGGVPSGPPRGTRAFAGDNFNGTAALQTPPYHLWSGAPGLRTGEPKEPLNVTFDVDTADFISSLPLEAGEAICQFELPHLCETRPHEDPLVEAWLLCWLDGVGGEVEAAAQQGLEEPALVLTGATLSGLSALASERPEVCPLLRSQLCRFEQALAARLQAWPPGEPMREGLVGPAAPTGERPSAAELELEIYAALDLLRDSNVDGVSEGGDFEINRSLISGFFPALTPKLVSDFRHVAVGWIFKLELLYGLYVVDQPERVCASGDGAWSRLSILSWDSNQFQQLLSCPFFRPEESQVWRLARRWWLEGNGQTLGPEQQERVSANFTEALVWEFLSPRLALGPEICGAATFPTPLNTAFVGGIDGGEQGGLSSGDALPVATDVDGAAATVTDSTGCIRVTGDTFGRVTRAKGCPLADLVAPPPAEDLHMHIRGESLHCWNAGREDHVVGAARQSMASRPPMVTGKLRLDLRILAGTQAESAHLFEVGLATAPWAGVHLKVHGPGAYRPQPRAELFTNAVGRSPPVPFLRFVEVTDKVVEGVRVSIEVDFGQQVATVRNIPSCGECSAVTPIGEWLDERARLCAILARPTGELDDRLFLEQAEHLHQTIDDGKLHEELAGVVLRDNGVRCVRGICVPEVPEEYHFYVVVPTGMELEIF
eukprot:TRINITY_DN43226_c0_g1_i1.p1 TRINITY_DN43226_c0_g1~~TRINITY_DN43226_c0_g1_i1.p1  ORF type:complete len:697 (+),score=108.87 TRINITY_DN43226_c0_g1_i1:124-2214(+)